MLPATGWLCEENSRCYGKNDVRHGGLVYERVMMDSLLTAKDLSRKLKISKATIYRWVNLGYIPHLKLGGALRFNEKSVMKWMEKRESAGRKQLSVDIFWE